MDTLLSLSRKKAIVKMKNRADGLLTLIADYLLLNGTLVPACGLLSGKMGVCLFLFHYSRYRDNEVVREYAIELLGKVLEEVNTDTLADYHRGIAGIGYGLEYLSRNDFLDIGKSPLLMDIDRKITMLVPCERRLGLPVGLGGFGKYLACRLRSRSGLSAAYCDTLLDSLHLILDVLYGNRERMTPEDIPGVLSFLREIKLSGVAEERVVELIGWIRANCFKGTSSFSLDLFFSLLMLPEGNELPFSLSDVQKRLVVFLTEKETTDRKVALQRFSAVINCKNALQENGRYSCLLPLLGTVIDEQLVRFSEECLENYLAECERFSLSGLAGLGLALLGYLDSDHNSYLQLC